MPTALSLLVGAALVFAVSIVMFGRWSDRVGRRRLIEWSCAALVPWSLIFFPLIDSKSVAGAAVALSGMLLIQGAYVGPQAAVFSELFPAALRYSGASLSLTLGTLFGGAIAPLVATALFGAAGRSWPVTAYLVIVAAISWWCARGLGETRRTDL